MLTLFQSFRNLLLILINISHLTLIPVQGLILFLFFWLLVNHRGILWSEVLNVLICFQLRWLQWVYNFFIPLASPCLISGLLEGMIFIKSMTMILTCNKIILFYLLLFWDSELIIPLLSSISSLSNLPDHSPHSSSKPRPYFPQIALESTYIHAYAYILPNITRSNHILLLMCMFTGLTLWYWIAN